MSVVLMMLRKFIFDSLFLIVKRYKSLFLNQRCFEGGKTK